MNKYIIILVVIWNIITFTMMGIDKYKAKKGMWRIKEKTLLLSSFFLGGYGAWCGMYVFHHKTRHKNFIIIVPLNVIMNSIIIYYILRVKY